MSNEDNSKTLVIEMQNILGQPVIFEFTSKPDYPDQTEITTRDKDGKIAKISFEHGYWNLYKNNQFSARNHNLRALCFFNDIEDFTSLGIEL